MAEKTQLISVTEKVHKQLRKLQGEQLMQGERINYSEIIEKYLPKDEQFNKKVKQKEKEAKE